MSPSAGTSRLTSSRVAAIPQPGTITVPRVATLPRAGSLSIGAPVVTRRARPIDVERVATTVPAAQSKAVPDTGSTLADAEHGKIAVADRVIAKIASLAAAENPEAGSVAATILGASVGRFGRRGTSLAQLPKTVAEVDGTRAYLTIELSVRYPSPVAAVTEAVRATVTERLRSLAGLEAVEVDIVVGALVSELPSAPRVR